MSTYAITFDVVGVPQRLQRFSRFVAEVSGPKPPLIASKRVALIWSKNFTEEGSLVGGWDGLGERTQDIRESQGFGREHPIMRRDGALFDVAIAGFMQQRTGAGTWAWTASDNYSGKPTTASLTITDGKARAVVTGWKVTNQWGFTSRGRKTPARPFWFVNPMVEQHARDGVRSFVNREAQKA